MQTDLQFLFPSAHPQLQRAQAAASDGSRNVRPFVTIFFNCTEKERDNNGQSAKQSKWRGRQAEIENRQAIFTWSNEDRFDRACFWGAFNLITLFHWRCRCSFCLSMAVVAVKSDLWKNYWRVGCLFFFRPFQRLHFVFVGDISADDVSRTLRRAQTIPFFYGQRFATKIYESINGIRKASSPLLCQRNCLLLRGFRFILRRSGDGFLPPQHQRPLYYYCRQRPPQNNIVICRPIKCKSCPCFVGLRGLSCAVSNDFLIRLVIGSPGGRSDWSNSHEEDQVWCTCCPTVSLLLLAESKGHVSSIWSAVNGTPGSSVKITCQLNCVMFGARVTNWSISQSMPIAGDVNTILFFVVGGRRSRDRCPSGRKLLGGNGTRGNGATKRMTWYKECVARWIIRFVTQVDAR